MVNDQETTLARINTLNLGENVKQDISEYWMKYQITVGHLLPPWFS